MKLFIIACLLIGVVFGVTSHPDEHEAPSHKASLKEQHKANKAVLLRVAVTLKEGNKTCPTHPQDFQRLHTFVGSSFATMLDKLHITAKLKTGVLGCSAQVQEDGCTKVIAKFVARVSSKKHMDDVHSLVSMITRAGHDSNPAICDIHGINCSELNVECIDVEPMVHKIHGTKLLKLKHLGHGDSVGNLHGGTTSGTSSGQAADDGRDADEISSGTGVDGSLPSAGSDNGKAGDYGGNGLGEDEGYSEELSSDNLVEDFDGLSDDLLKELSAEVDDGDYEEDDEADDAEQQAEKPLDEGKQGPGASEGANGHPDVDGSKSNATSPDGNKPEDRKSGGRRSGSRRDHGARRGAHGRSRHHAEDKAQDDTQEGKSDSWEVLSAKPAAPTVSTVSTRTDGRQWYDRVIDLAKAASAALQLAAQQDSVATASTSTSLGGSALTYKTAAAVSGHHGQSGIFDKRLWSDKIIGAAMVAPAPSAAAAGSVQTAAAAASKQDVQELADRFIEFAKVATSAFSTKDSSQLANRKGGIAVVASAPGLHMATGAPRAEGAAAPLPAVSASAAAARAHLAAIEEDEQEQNEPSDPRLWPASMVAAWPNKARSLRL